MADCEECFRLGLSQPRKTTRTIIMKGREVSVCEECWADEATQQLWTFLIEGKAPGGMTIRGFKPLQEDQAIGILHVLQRFFGALPDRWELCDNCLELFNSEDNLSIVTPSGVFCEDCRDNFGDVCSKCEEPFDYVDLTLVDDGYICKNCS